MYISAIFYCFPVFLLLATCTGYSTTTELYEGNQCALTNGTTGECKKISECPPILEEAKSGLRGNNGAGRCGFDSFVEIVCCPSSLKTKIGVRPSDRACHEYENEVTSTQDSPDDDLNFHILEGARAATGEFPYMASLGYKNTDGEIDKPIAYDCGGALISSRFVLTAAHCVINIHNKVPILVRIGSKNLVDAGPDIQEITVSRIIPHPMYKPSVNYHDIALVRLATSARMSNNVKPICLDTRSLATTKLDSNTSIVAIGFGATSLDQFSSDTLMKTMNLRLVPRNECTTSYTGVRKLPAGLNEKMICAIDTNTTRGSDACQGDSGGPLLVITDTSSSVIGVTSFGQSCGGNVPGVYTSVFSYLDWIENEVWSEQTKA